MVAYNHHLEINYSSVPLGCLPHIPQLVFGSISHSILICLIQKPTHFQFYHIPYPTSYKVLLLLPWIEHSNRTILNPIFITSCLHRYHHTLIHSHNPNLFLLQNLLQYHYPHLWKFKYFPKSYQLKCRNFCYSLLL